MNSEEQISVIFPEVRKININGKDFEIKPFTFGFYPRVLKAFKTAAKTIQNLQESGQQLDNMLILEVFTESGEEIITLLADFLKIEREHIENLLPDDAIFLIKSCIEVNSDFFKKKVMPILIPQK